MNGKSLVAVSTMFPSFYFPTRDCLVHKRALVSSSTSPNLARCFAADIFIYSQRGSVIYSLHSLWSSTTSRIFPRKSRAFSTETWRPYNVKSLVERAGFITKMETSKRFIEFPRKSGKLTAINISHWRSAKRRNPMRKSMCEGISCLNKFASFQNHSTNNSNARWKLIQYLCRRYNTLWNAIAISLNQAEVQLMHSARLTNITHRLLSRYEDSWSCWIENGKVTTTCKACELYFQYASVFRGIKASFATNIDTSLSAAIRWKNRKLFFP